MKEVLLVVTLVLVCPGASIFAGGGPENLILVVNADSDSSKLIANYYAQLRNIPGRNVIYLNGVPPGEKTSLQEFRNKILLPIYEQVKARGLASQVEYVVYSSDFPTSIDIGEAVKSLGPTDGNSRLMRPSASINSLTYFMHQVLTNNSSFISLYANSYMRQSTSNLLIRPFYKETQARFTEAVRAMRSGDLDESATILAELHKAHPNQLAVSYWLARVYAEKSDPEKAGFWLKQSVAAGWSYRAYSQSDPVFRKIRDDAGFKEIVDSIPESSYRFLPTLGFRGAYGWGANGMINTPGAQGENYLLSTVLAVTRYRGLSERQALDQIMASVKADGSRPRGRFYFCRTNDIRTKTRVGSFEVAIDELRALGYESEIIEGAIPTGKDDIIGLTMGTAKFNFAKSKSKIVAGAICENLTSFGGRLDAPGQTPLTEFLRFGAAGSSGTVIEPYAIQEKFPHPRIHVHYVRGCSLAESFYQSVHGPFQLLIVGDALCQPWAVFPDVAIHGLEPMQGIEKVHEIQLDFKASPVAVAGFEFYVDGRLIQRFSKMDTLSFDSTTMPDGFHELRIVAIAEDMIGSRGRAVMPFVVSNKGRWVRLSSQKNQVDVGDDIELSAETNCGETIELVQNMRVIATGPGPKAVFKVSAKTLGRGPVRLSARVKTDDEYITSSPVEMTIEGKISTIRSVARSPKPAQRKRKQKSKLGPKQ